MYPRSSVGFSFNNETYRGPPGPQGPIGPQGDAGLIPHNLVGTYHSDVPSTGPIVDGAYLSWKKSDSGGSWTYERGENIWLGMYARQPGGSNNIVLGTKSASVYSPTDPSDYVTQITGDDNIFIGKQIYTSEVVNESNGAIAIGNNSFPKSSDVNPNSVFLGNYAGNSDPVTPANHLAQGKNVIILNSSGLAASSDGYGSIIHNSGGSVASSGNRNISISSNSANLTTSNSGCIIINGGTASNTLSTTTDNSLYVNPIRQVEKAAAMTAMAPPAILPEGYANSTNLMYLMYDISTKEVFGLKV